MMSIKPTPLPPVQTTNLDHPDALSAYNICFTLERNVNTEEDCMHARILGYLILNAPSLEAQVEVIKAIDSCFQDKKKLLELGRCFALWFILPFKKFRGQTPSQPEHPSPPECNKIEKDLKEKTMTLPRDYQAAKTQALYRDGYKCPVTGLYDKLAVDISLVTRESVAAEGNGVIYTRLAYILPPPPTSSLTEEDYGASVLAVMKSFGYDKEINNLNIHSLSNVITMEVNAQDAFDQLELWFESTEKNNCYHVKAIHPTPFFHSGATFTFTSPDPLALPYPSPQFLAMHAACAKVAHLSGAYEYIKKLHEDMCELGVLESDGTSSVILTHALWMSSRAPRPAYDRPLSTF